LEEPAASIFRIKGGDSSFLQNIGTSSMELHNILSWNATPLIFTAVRTSNLMTKQLECIFMYVCIIMPRAALCSLVRSPITGHEKRQMATP